MFTGSAKTGKTVLKAAAEQMIPCYLELGGKDPMIVCADADIERAANAAAFYGHEQRRPGLHLGRARVRRGAGVRPVRRRRSPTTSAACARARPPASAPSTSARSRSRRSSRSSTAHVRDAVAKGAKVLDRWPPAARARPLLRADRARRRRSLDEDHAGRDVRPDAADHASRRRRGGRAARQRLRLRPAGERLDGRHRARRGARAPHRGRRGVRQRRPDQLHRAEPARWEAGRRRGWAPVTAPRGFASTPRSSRCWSPSERSSASRSCSPTAPRRTMLLRRFFKLFYGRGSRD